MPTPDARPLDAPSPGDPLGGARAWAAVLALAVGIFVLITIEELPIAVLSVMAPDLGVSTGMAGLTVTLPGVLAALVAIATPVLTRGLDRRLVLVIALVCVAISCGASVIAPGLLLLLVARAFTGIAIGLYWAVLPVVATRQVAPARTATALTLAFSGVGGALVLGVPLASWIGAHLGWRAAFGVIGALSLVVLVLVLILVRPVHSEAALGLGDLRAAAANPGVRCALLLTAVIVTGQFITYSFVSPLLHDQAHVPTTALSALLLAFGISGLIGNFAVGPVLRRSPGLAVLLIASGIALSLLAFLLLVRTPLGAALVMPAWGLFAGAASVAIQAFVSREAAQLEESGTALNSAAYNLAIALGALIGGRIVDGAGQRPAMVVTIVMMALGAAVAARWLLAHRHPARDASGA